MSHKISIISFCLIVLLCNPCLILKAQNPFVKNGGQLPAQVKAKVILPSGSLFIEEGSLFYNFYSGKQLEEIHNLEDTLKKIDGHAYSIKFLNCNNNILTEFIDESSYHENYFLRDKSSWTTGVKSYKQLYQYNIYNGIDIKYYTDNGNLKYDFIISENSNSNEIKMKYEGVQSISINNGNLITTTSVNKITEYKPYAYQLINGVQREVACFFKLRNDIVSFNLPKGYDKKYKLFIDPVLNFSTYSGSTSDNFGYSATYDNSGFLYSASTVFGAGYPTTIGAYQVNYANGSTGTDIAITKYDTTGMHRIYSTYLGGSLDELPHSMIVNLTSELFIYGTTASSDFPTTALAFQKNFNGGTGFSPSGIGVSFPNGSDIFVSRLSANGGNLLSSTYIGGTDNDGLNTAQQLKYNYADEVRGEIDIDKQNNIYIASCTNSIDFPTINSFQLSSIGSQEGCLIKMDNLLSTIIWSTYLGGSNDDAIYSLALDNSENIYVTGGTNSVNFPTKSNAYQSAYQDSIKADAFVSMISSDGSQLLASTYFGTTEYDQSYFVEIGSEGRIYLLGQTENQDPQIIYNATYSVLGAGQFIAVFNHDLSNVLRSTVVGTGKGSPDISPTAFLVDICNKVYVAGWGSNLGGSLSTLNLPVSLDAFQQNTDGNDFYLMVLDDSLSTIIYATFFGGSQSTEHVDGGTSRFDKKGVIYQSVCAGCGGNSDFPVEPNPGAVSITNLSSNCNNGVFKFDFEFPIVIADFTTQQEDCNTTVVFHNKSTSSSTVDYVWDFGDGTTSTDLHPTHSFLENGFHNIMLIVKDNNSCNLADTITKQIYILSSSTNSIDSIIKCPTGEVQIGLLPNSDTAITYYWTPSLSLSSTNISNPFCNVDTTQTYLLIISNGTCTDTLLQKIYVVDLFLEAGPDRTYCNAPILISANNSNNITNIHWSSNYNFSDTLSLSEELLIDNISSVYVKATDGYCVVLDSIKVLSQSINISLFGNNICIGDSTIIGVTNLNPDIPIISYMWNQTNLNASAVSDTPNTSTWYVVEVVNIEGCSIKDSIYVNVYDYPIIDSIWASEYIIFKGASFTLNVISQDSILWQEFNNNNYTQQLFATNSQCYSFQIYNNNHCFIEDSICVEVNDVFCNVDSILIPTAFSPNNDPNLLNENYFILDKAGVITKFRLEIFNRLGQKVFFSNDISNKWDGTFKGKKLSPQVFDFFVDLECIGGKTLFHKGNITLIR